ncbi:MAG: DUF4136 domain-containing protein [Hahellaceae bacterium]|nr:DUF4136 domain-containing protein [Hahellaceae bacterium]
MTRRWLERVWALCLLAGIGVLSGCSGVEVRTDYDVNFDFAAVKSYQWEASDAALSLDLQRFRAAVAAQLAKQSYQNVTDGAAPDLRVRLQVTTEPRQEVRQMPAMGWRGFWGGDTELYLHDYELLWYVVEMFRPDDDRVVWFGAAALRKEPGDLTPAEKVELANEAAGLLFEKFPSAP